MIRHNIKAFAYVIILLAFCTYGIIFLADQFIEYINLSKINYILTTISINIFIWLIFIKWAWKWKIFYPWLVQIPNLAGSWKGVIKTNWEGKLKSIPTAINITQSFFHIQIKIKTKESESRSIGASFNIDKEKGYQQLIYSYQNEPNSNIRDRSAIHYGSTLLNFEGFKVLKMKGEYWTSRKTVGEIELKR